MKQRSDPPARFGGSLAISACLFLAACGGGGSSGGGGSGTITSSAPTNILAVTVDAGPAALNDAGYSAVNTLFASVTLCTPGSTTACETIDHMQVDTGSTGIRFLAAALSGKAVPAALTDAGSGNPLRECVQFADGYVWGSLATADIQLGSRTLSGIPVHILGDGNAGSAPASCVSGPEEDTVAEFGANGVIGIGNFLQDCGEACVSQAISATYYVCAGGTCTPTSVPLQTQVGNPIASMGSDNNGVMIDLPAISAPGAATVSGNLYFGIGTESNNALGSAAFLTLDDTGALITNFGGSQLGSSIIDSGSNGYFFDADSISTCSDFTSFYCPANSAGTAISVAENASIQGMNGTTSSVSFTVDNADSLFQSEDTALPTLAGPNSTPNGPSNSFAWGLPFFYGRPMFVLLENATVSGVTGPALAF